MGRCVKSFLYSFCIFLVQAWITHVYAFCGFYVAKADASLYNKASQVVIVRHEEKTVISMMNDYKGELKEFAMVIPVSQVLERGQIHVGNKKLFEHIDAYSAPRLVEYFDENPCLPIRLYKKRIQSGLPAKGRDRKRTSARSLGVKVEASYTVGEYDILILSAKESQGLEQWLRENGYKIPRGAHRALRPYIKRKMKFIVAKINLKEQVKTGLSYLRPLQFAFESKKFMLPIRLGMLNADGPQDLLIYILTKKGRVELTNYRNVKLPSGMDLPVYVKKEFESFYKAMFNEQVRKEKNRVVFTEYFWNMGWCDPCAADPLSPKELRELGVFWLQDYPQARRKGRQSRLRIRPPWPRKALPVMVTRLHVRYKKNTFKEDLMFQETSDTKNFQTRYALRHPWKGNPDQCPRAKQYLNQLPQRQDKEAQNLARLTGWSIHEIRKKMKLSNKPEPWWKGIWE